MHQTFANLPIQIQDSLSEILQKQDQQLLFHAAQQLHIRYSDSSKKREQGFLNELESFAYLGIRFPATYAQIIGALSQIADIIPHWQPKSVLDIGSGPGTGLLAATTVWPSIQQAECIDANRHLLRIGEQLLADTVVAADTKWLQRDLREGVDPNDQFDVVIIGNVLNELSPAQQEKVFGQAWNATKGLLLLVEPGTPEGSKLIATCARKLAQSSILVAPYIQNNFVEDSQYWLHFSQRFIRPEFQRRLRQKMRQEHEMASDWEDAKFSYCAFSRIPSEKNPLARCVGPITLQKGFLSCPMLTSEAIVQKKILKRDKEAYHLYKSLKWGEAIY